MQWVQLVLVLLRLLKELIDAISEDDLDVRLASLPISTQGRLFNWLLRQLQDAIPDEIGDGRLIAWLWEHREEIVDFIFDLIDRIGSGDDVAVLTSDDIEPVDIKLLCQEILDDE